jgi:hypothetical protein
VKEEREGVLLHHACPSLESTRAVYSRALLNVDTSRLPFPLIPIPFPRPPNLHREAHSRSANTERAMLEHRSGGQQRAEKGLPQCATSSTALVLAGEVRDRTLDSSNEARGRRQRFARSTSSPKWLERCRWRSVASWGEQGAFSFFSLLLLARTENSCTLDEATQLHRASLSLPLRLLAVLTFLCVAEVGFLPTSRFPFESF